MGESYCTVWQYRAKDYETGRYYWRVVFFYAGSVNYDGMWGGPSLCVWMVPRRYSWE